MKFLFYCADGEGDSEALGLDDLCQDGLDEELPPQALVWGGWEGAFGCPWGRDRSAAGLHPCLGCFSLTYRGKMLCWRLSAAENKCLYCHRN